MLIKLISLFTFSFFLSAVHAQPKVLLEACNAIDERGKRMECLEKLMQLQSSTTSMAGANDLHSLAIKRAKAAFAAIASTVQSGVSYNNYSLLVVDPAKELGILRQGVPKLNGAVFDKLQLAVTAYNDAATVWRASIYQSQDGGLLVGRILNPERTGLMPIVDRYGLQTTTVLLNQHLPAEYAIASIWRYAATVATEAFDIAEGVSQSRVESSGEKPDLSKDEESLVGKLARDRGCNTHPVVAKAGVIDGKNEYTVSCTKGNTLNYRCTAGACIAL